MQKKVPGIAAGDFHNDARGEEEGTRGRLLLVATSVFLYLLLLAFLGHMRNVGCRGEVGFGKFRGLLGQLAHAVVGRVGCREG